MSDTTPSTSSPAAAKAGPTAVTRRLTGALVKGNRSGNVDQGMGQGMEMALTIAVFLGIGWGLDVWLDTRPIFMIGLVIFSTVGQFIKMWFIYDARMKMLENERRQGKNAHQQRAAATTQVDPEV
jgi:F0F1-type ATP synthase assembly protein I